MPAKSNYSVAIGAETYRSKKGNVMNYCQVECETEKFLAAQCILDDAHEAAVQEAESQVNNFCGEYYWAKSENMLEALSEIDTPLNAMTGGLTYQEQLGLLIGAQEYEAYGKLCEEISKEYWTTYLAELDC